MEHTEKTKEEFTNLFVTQLTQGFLKQPTSKVIEDFLFNTLIENIEHAYDMYLYCLDVYNKVRVGEGAKYTVSIETRKGKGYIITNRDVCIKLKRRFKTYEKFCDKFKDDIDVFAYIWKHLPTYSTAITVEQLLGAVNGTTQLSELEITDHIKLFSLVLGAKIYIDDIWDYIPED